MECKWQYLLLCFILCIFCNVRFAINGKLKCHCSNNLFSDHNSIYLILKQHLSTAPRNPQLTYLLKFSFYRITSTSLWTRHSSLGRLAKRRETDRKKNMWRYSNIAIRIFTPTDCMTLSNLRLSLRQKYVTSAPLILVCNPVLPSFF